MIILTAVLSQFMEVVDSLETEGMTVTELLKVCLEGCLSE